MNIAAWNVRTFIDWDDTDRPHSRVLERSQEPMYGTRPWCLVQAITRHTCPDPHLGSWNCLPQQAHIAPSEPMSSIDHRPAGFESRLVPNLPFPLIPTLIGLRAFDLVSSPVWWEAATNSPHRRTAFIAYELAKYQIDIASLSETRLTGKEEMIEESSLTVVEKKKKKPKTPNATTAPPPQEKGKKI